MSNRSLRATLRIWIIFAAVIAISDLAGRWNTSDLDHYMGFDKLRPARKRNAPNGDKHAKNE
ncbi:hypothetical protein WGT02_34455 (plasmid) [Rhizobium sp. T1470]|uniref:hypothetical protein n=1 Tax=unclassified Rhizobium TaxID=2613769 RepID=UPI001AAE3F67|nr:hypothetical protein [Rhizobium sp. T1473]MCA0806748.1 hypothetical protein [Rhizobium sp. T1473]